MDLCYLKGVIVTTVEDAWHIIVHKSRTPSDREKEAGYRVTAHESFIVTPSNQMVMYVP